MSSYLQSSASNAVPAPIIDQAMCDRTVLRSSPDVQGRSMDGETVLLDLSSGRYYTLNRVGSVIWEQCTGDKTISDIQAVLSDRFDVAPERALDDLVTLVNELIQEGLLQQERR